MSDENHTQDEKTGKLSGSGQWLAIGLAVGVAIGVATDNLALWIALGVAIGAAMTAVKKRRARLSHE